MKHLVVSIESLGRQAGAGILEVGWCIFDDYTHDFKSLKEPVKQAIAIPVEQNIASGLKATAENAKFWTEQRDGYPTNKSGLRPNATMPQLLSEIASIWNEYWYTNTRHIWTKYPFYLSLLETAYDICGVERPLLLKAENFRNRRCIHTFLRTVGQVSWQAGVASSLSSELIPITTFRTERDATAQALELSFVCSRLRQISEDSNHFFVMKREVEAEAKERAEKLAARRNQRKEKETNARNARNRNKKR